MKTPQERRKSAFWAAFWGGMAAPVMLYMPEAPRFTRISEVRFSKQNDLNAMRSDWIAVGDDFKYVIAKQQENQPG